MDIGIYTTLDTINHEFGGDHEFYGGYWDFTATLPKVEVGDKFWVAWGGRWRGYFTVNEVIDGEVFCGFSDALHGSPVPPRQFLGYDDRLLLRLERGVWFSGWTEKEGGERRPFQGFTYKVPSSESGQ